MTSAKAMNELKPYMAMVMMQIGYSGMFIVAVASLKKGMNHYILVVYRNLVAALVIAPFALYFERHSRPKLTAKVALKILALSIIEPVLDQNFYYMGAQLTSASFASALLNILPAVTFIMAAILRMEKIKIRERRSQVKIIGTVITIVAALLMILYKGPVVPFPWSKGTHHETSSVSQKGTGNWLKGIIMLILCTFCWSGFFILQSNTLKTYPAELTLTTWICTLGALMNTGISLVVEKGDMKPWIIGFDMRLFTAVYSGVVCSGVAYYVQGLVVKQRGPVFVTAFNPLCMIITAILGSILLGEEITLGSVIGAVIIVIGLYALIWGKGKDHLNKSSVSSDSTELPFSTVHDCKLESVNNFGNGHSTNSMKNTP
ncbi:hypothetical protein LUZ60_001298 [Juncus effusus]|nr:hypothetical protein LUZ60_001298 [Juncus effusus]